MDRRFLPSSSPPLLLLVLLLLFTATVIASASSSDDDDRCVYTVYVRTGSIMKGGTDARIGLSLGDAAGGRVDIPDLEPWGGLMGPGHDYYERGSVDAFSGRGPCRPSGGPLCRLNLTSDGAGAHHGWFCDYVEVTSTGPHVPCSQTLFYVRQWLANDAPPYQLYASVDGCGTLAAAEGLSSHFVVGNAEESESTSSSSSAAFSA